MKSVELLCPFCDGKMHPSHSLNLGNLQSLMWKCSDCSYGKVNPEFPPDAIAAHYEKDYFQAHAWEINKAKILSTDYWSKIKDFIKQNRNLELALEIGAGFGFFASLFELHTKKTIDLVEPSDTCVNVITAANWKGKIYRNIDQISGGKKFDIIFSFHVLEHLQEPNKILEFASSHLNPNGQFISLTPNGASSTLNRHSANWGWSCPNQHYQFFSEYSPNRLFEKHDFQVVAKLGRIPAPIHYPSAWHARALEVLKRPLNSDRNSNWSKLFRKRIKRKLAKWSVSRFGQNKTNNGLCRIEIAWSKITNRKPFDELLLVLKKNN